MGREDTTPCPTECRRGIRTHGQELNLHTQLLLQFSGSRLCNKHKTVYIMDDFEFAVMSCVYLWHVHTISTEQCCMPRLLTQPFLALFRIITLWTDFVLAKTKQIAKFECQRWQWMCQLLHNFSSLMQSLLPIFCFSLNCATDLPMSFLLPSYLAIPRASFLPIADMGKIPSL